MGLGNITGAPLTGMLSDRIVVKWQTRRGGVRVPEDRLSLRSGDSCSALHRPVRRNNTFCGGPFRAVLSARPTLTADMMHSHSTEMMAVYVAGRVFHISKKNSVHS
ncbi:hypothetical protein FB451DRAFT_1209708 [Mycena latifolia]|nr:hypothetical protein FB451DRAFT_1209708 [Mycena latifolia]